MKNYKYLLFDWDGTIAKTLDIWFTSLKTSLKGNGYSLTDKQIGADFSRFEVRFKAVYNTDPADILSQAIELSNKNIPSVELYSGAVESLRQLHKSGKKLAAAKNAGIDSILFYPDKHEKFYDLEDLSLLKPTFIIKDFRQFLTII